MTAQIERRPSSKAELDRIAAKLADLEARINALASSNNQGKPKGELCTERKHGVISAQGYVEPNPKMQPKLEVVETVAKQNIVSGTVTRTKITELATTFVGGDRRTKKLGEYWLMPKINLSKQKDFIKRQEVSLTKGSLDCYTLEGKKFTKVFKNGQELTGDAKKSQLEALGAVTSGAVPLEREDVREVIQMSKKADIISIGMQRNIGQNSSFSLTGGSSSVSIVSTGVNAKTTNTPGSAQIIEESNAWTGTSESSLDITGGRTKREINRMSPTEHDVRTLDVGFGVKSKITATNTLSFDVHGSIAIDSERKDIIDTGDFTDYGASVGLYNDNGNFLNIKVDVDNVSDDAVPDWWFGGGFIF